MGVQQQNTPVNKPKTTKPMSEARKIRKPLMERKRRERINTCLNDLASFLVDAKMVKTEPGKPTKLEKADILELTVKHIKNLKTQDKITPTSEIEEDKPTSSYKEGFTKCMGMVDQTLGKAGKEALRQRLLAHLKVCLQTLDPPSEESKDSTSASPSAIKNEEVGLRETEKNISSIDSKTDSETDSKVDLETNDNLTRLTLVPTRLPSGGVAFVIQGGIDPSLLLPQKDCKESSTVVRDSVSPPPSPTTCDSSTSSTSSSTPSPISAPPVPAPFSSSSTCPTTTVISSQCSTTPPPQPTSSQISASTSVASQTPTTSGIVTHHYYSQSQTSKRIPSPVASDIHCQPSEPYVPLMYPHESPLISYCPPSSSNQAAPPASHIPHVHVQSYPIPSNPTQPQPIPYHPALPHHSYNPPTPPPSISPHNQLVYQYQHYQSVSSEEDMDTDGLSEEEIDVEVENDVPYDLSMRRIWRFW